MYPIICKIGPFSIFSYGLMLAVSAIICSTLMSRDAGRQGLSREFIVDLIFWIVLGGILGARLFYIILNLQFFIENPREIIMVQHGGLAWQGALVAGVFVGVFMIKKKQMPLWTIVDLAAPYIALGEAIGRIGCFLNGCCFGRPVPWGIYSPVHQAHLHPAQLYATAELLLVFFVLKFFQRRTHAPGQIFAMYLILASLQRFINEFFRGDHVNTALGLSVFQIVSLIIFMAGCILSVMIGKKKNGKTSYKS